MTNLSADITTATSHTRDALKQLAAQPMEVENRVVSARSDFLTRSGALGFELSFTDSSVVVEFELGGIDKWSTHPFLITDFEENYGFSPTEEAVFVQTVVNGVTKNKWIEPDIKMAIDTALHESEDVLIEV
jgi:hypothetical protein